MIKIENTALNQGSDESSLGIYVENLEMNTQDQPNKGTYCDGFRLKKELQKHIRDNNIFSCEFRDEVFDSESVIPLHMQTMHEKFYDL